MYRPPFAALVPYFEDLRSALLYCGHSEMSLIA